MRNVLQATIAASVLSIASAANFASATVFTDPGYATHVGGANPTGNDISPNLNGSFETGGNTDLYQLTITNNATTITFTSTTSSTPNFTNRYYYLGIHTPGAALYDTSLNNNPAGRNFHVNAGGADLGINGHAIFPDNPADIVDAGLAVFGPTGWVGVGTTPLTVSGNSVSYTIPLAALNLSPGQVILVSEASTSDLGNGCAIDSIADDTLAVDGSYSQHDTVNTVSYTIQPAPEPGSIALATIAGASLLRRSRTRVR